MLSRRGPRCRLYTCCFRCRRMCPLVCVSSMYPNCIVLFTGLRTLGLGSARAGQLNLRALHQGSSRFKSAVVPAGGVVHLPAETHVCGPYGPGWHGCLQSPVGHAMQLVFQRVCVVQTCMRLSSVAEGAARIFHACMLFGLPTPTCLFVLSTRVHLFHMAGRLDHQLWCACVVHAWS